MCPVVSQTPRPAHEAHRGSEAVVDAIERDEVVEQIVRIVGRDPPREWRSRDAARAACPSSRTCGSTLWPADDERKIQVDAGRRARSRAPRADRVDDHRGDRRSVEQIVARRGSRRRSRSRRRRCERRARRCPRARLAIDARAADDRHRRAGRVEPDATRVEELHALRRADVEQAARLEEELALLGKERRESREVDDLLIRSRPARSRC